MAEIWETNSSYFLNNVLSTPGGAPPKGAQWVIAFDDLPGKITPAIDLALSYEQPGGNKWNIKAAAKEVTNAAFQSTRGCVFAQALALPGENIVANPEGSIVSNSFLRSYVGQGRNIFPIMRITFMDSNANFVDNFCRPWAIATGAFGMIARAPGTTENYRTNMTCYKLGTFAAGKPAVPIMKMQFFDICCIAVTEEAYSYGPVTSPMMREAEFVYNYYTVDSSMGSAFYTGAKNPTHQVASPETPATLNIYQISLGQTGTPTASPITNPSSFSKINAQAAQNLGTTNLGSATQEYNLVTGQVVTAAAQSGTPSTVAGQQYSNLVTGQVAAAQQGTAPILAVNQQEIQAAALAQALTPPTVSTTASFASKTGEAAAAAETLAKR